MRTVLCWFRGHLNINELNVHKWLEYLNDREFVLYLAQIQNGSQTRNEAARTYSLDTELDGTVCARTKDGSRKCLHINWRRTYLGSFGHSALFFHLSTFERASEWFGMYDRERERDQTILVRVCFVWACVSVISKGSTISIWAHRLRWQAWQDLFSASFFFLLRLICYVLCAQMMYHILNLIQAIVRAHYFALNAPRWGITLEILQTKEWRTTRNSLFSSVPQIQWWKYEYQCTNENECESAIATILSQYWLRNSD